MEMSLKSAMKERQTSILVRLHLVLNRNLIGKPSQNPYNMVAHMAHTTRATSPRRGVRFKSVQGVLRLLHSVYYGYVIILFTNQLQPSVRNAHLASARKRQYPT